MPSAGVARTAGRAVSVGEGRVEYRTAGKAHRDVIRYANRLRPRITSRQRSVLDAVLVQTASYSKLEDWTSIRQLARIVLGEDEPDGRDRSWVADELKALRDLGLIGLATNGKRGRAARICVSIPGTAAQNAANREGNGRGEPDHSTDDEAAMAGASGVNGRVPGMNGRVPGTGMAAESAAHREVPGNQTRAINPRRAEARVRVCWLCFEEGLGDVLAPCPLPGHSATFSKAVPA